MLTIAWDIDDVLNDLMRTWFEKKWLIDHPDCLLSYQKLTKNPPHNLLGISKKEYLLSLDEFRLSSQYMEMSPIPEVIKWFDQYGDSYRHIAITAVPLKAAHISAAWLLKNFGRWFRAFYFVPSPRAGEDLPNYDDTKQVVLKRLEDIDVFIDDNEYNLDGVENMGIKSILFPRPWNKGSLSIADFLASLKTHKRLK